MANVLIDNFTATNDGSGPGSINEAVNVYYDDVAHSVSTDSLLVSYTESDRVANVGDLLHQQTVGYTRYDVTALGSNPFAEVAMVDITPPCDLLPDVALVVHETVAGASDGQITADNASSSNGPIEYSLDNIVFQAGNVFTGVPPGSYTLYLRDALNCTAQIDNVVVNAGAAANDLSIDEAATDAALTHETSPGAADGTITVVATSSNGPLEYSLNGTLWQTSSLFAALPPASYIIHVRDVQGFTDNYSVTIDPAVAIVCDLAIDAGQIALTAETAPGASNGSIDAQGATSSHGPIEYSVDNVNWQNQPLFSNLAPGFYRVFFRDAQGCANQSPVLTVPTAGIAPVVVPLNSVTPIVEWPQAQSHRFVKTIFPNYEKAFQNFDNTLFADLRIQGVEPNQYFQKVHFEKPSTVQWWTNFGTNSMELYDIQGNLVQSFPATKKSEYIGYSTDAEYQAADNGNGQVQIGNGFFNLPEWAIEGQVITVTGGSVASGNYTIDAVTQGTGVFAGHRVMLITAAYIGVPISATANIDVTYDRYSYEVYEASVDWNQQATGKYYLVLKGYEPQFGSYELRSEPIEVVQSYTRLSEVAFANYDTVSYGTHFDTGIIHKVLVESQYLPLPAKGNRKVMRNSSRELIKLEAYTNRATQLNTDKLPPYLHELLANAFDFDYVTINGVRVKTDKGYTYRSLMSRGYALANGSIELEERNLGENNTDIGNLQGNGNALQLDGKILDIDD